MQCNSKNVITKRFPTKIDGCCSKCFIFFERILYVYIVLLFTVEMAYVCSVVLLFMIEMAYVYSVFIIFLFEMAYVFQSQCQSCSRSITIAQHFWSVSELETVV